MWGVFERWGLLFLLWQSDGKMYSLDALKIGIDVRAEELSNIYDTFIVLDDARTVGNSGHYSPSGKIIFLEGSWTISMTESIKGVNAYP